MIEEDQARRIFPSPGTRSRVRALRRAPVPMGTSERDLNSSVILHSREQRMMPTDIHMRRLTMRNDVTVALRTVAVALRVEGGLEIGRLLRCATAFPGRRNS